MRLSNKVGTVSAIRPKRDIGYCTFRFSREKTIVLAAGPHDVSVISQIPDRRCS